MKDLSAAQKVGGRFFGRTECCQNVDGRSLGHTDSCQKLTEALPVAWIDDRT